MKDRDVGGQVGEDARSERTESLTHPYPRTKVEELTSSEGGRGSGLKRSKLGLRDAEGAASKSGSELGPVDVQPRPHQSAARGRALSGGARGCRVGASPGLPGASTARRRRRPGLGTPPVAPR